MNKGELKKIQKETCFLSLAYCCGLEKDCPTRNKVIEMLGLDKKDFVKLKKKFDENLLEVLKSK